MIWCSERMLPSALSAGPRHFRGLRALCMRFLNSIVLAIVVAASAVAEAASPLPIEIPQNSGTLHALLYKPDGDGPFSAVIALHGCDGLGAHPEAIQSRYRDWAEQLLKAGK